MTRTVLYLMPAGDKGGAEVVIETLVRHLDRSRYRPVVAFLRPGRLVADFEAAGVQTITLPAHRARNPVGIAQAIRGLRGAVAQAGAAIVHANAGHLLTYATAATLGTPARVVWHVHDPLGNGSWHERLFRLTQRWMRPDATVFANPAVAASHLAAYPRIALHRTILPGVDPARFARADGGAARRALDLPPEAPLVVMVARLQAFKGHDHLLAAAPTILAAHPSARIVIAGGTMFGREPAYGHALRARAKALGIADAVVFTGYVPDAVRDGLVATASVLVHPADYEPLGLSVLEAMAAGVPVVAADADGPRLTVGDGGILVPRRNPAALARAVVALLDDPARAAALGAAGRRRVERHFSISAMVGAFEELYDTVVGERPVTSADCHG